MCLDYSLGPLDYLFKDPEVEALLYVLAYSDILAREPDAASPQSPMVPAISTVPEPANSQTTPKRHFHPDYAMVNGRSFATGTYVSMALVDRQGNILWYGGKTSHKGVDLRERAGVDEMTKMVLNLLRAKERK